MSQFITQIEQLYIAYFSRPADAGGLDYWDKTIQNATQNGDIKQVLSNIGAAFGHSAEYLGTYAGLNNQQVVDQVYHNLFGRAAESDGLAFWAGKLDSGALTLDNVVQEISHGAQGSDKIAFDCKVDAGSWFTQGLNTAQRIMGYSGTAANNLIKPYIATITDYDQLHIFSNQLDIIIDNVTGAGPQSSDILSTLPLLQHDIGPLPPQHGMGALPPTEVIGLIGQASSHAHLPVMLLA